MTDSRQIRQTPGVAVDWAFVLTGMVAAQGFVAVAVILLARRVAPLDYGQYVSCYALAALLVVIPGFGLDSWLLSRGATADRLLPLWHAAFRLRGRLLAAWFVGLALVSTYLPPETFPPSLLLLTAVAVGLESITSLAYSALRNLGLHRAITVIQATGGLTLVVAAVVLPLESWGPTLFALSRVLVAALVAALAVALVRRETLVGEVPLGARQLLRAARPFLVGDVAVSVYMRADLTVVSLFLGAAAAGIYGPALSLVNMGFLVPSALYSVVLPRLSASYTARGGTFYRLGLRQLYAQAITGVVLALLMYFLAPLVVEVVFGPAYAASSDMLRLLGPLLVAKGLSFGLGAWLTASRAQAWRSGVQVAVAAFNLAANLVVVVPLGLVGVAVVYVISEAFLSVGYAVGVRRRWLADQARVPA